MATLSPDRKSTNSIQYVYDRYELRQDACVLHSAADGGGGATGAVCPECKGAPNSAELFQILAVSDCKV